MMQVPNWCYNYLVLRHPNKSMIDELVSEVEKISEAGDSGLFEILRLRPEDQNDNWYDWNLTNWGTKWEVSLIDYDRVDDNTFETRFDTAWSPPTALYEYLTEQGWGIEAYYHESGTCYCGKYEDGKDRYFAYDSDDPESMVGIPEDIADFAGFNEFNEEEEE